MAGRKVQLGRPPTVDASGVVHGVRLVPEIDEGTEVTWSEFLLEQYRAGDILLHPLTATPSPPVIKAPTVTSWPPASEKEKE